MQSFFIGGKNLFSTILADLLDKYKFKDWTPEYILGLQDVCAEKTSGIKKEYLEN